MDQNESELERRLRRYQPAGPPLDLRNRIVGSTRTRRSWTVREWVPAAAAAAAAVLFYMMSAGLWTKTAQLVDRDEVRQAAVDDLAQQLGDDEVARAEAERIVRLEELGARIEAEAGDQSEKGAPVQ